MPSTPRARSSRAATSARERILEQLKDDHKRVKKAYREFRDLDRDEQPEACEAIVRQVLNELDTHAALEEELLYPAARDVIADEDLIDEAQVEHESLHALIGHLRNLGPDDEKFAARFTVLCEYVLHHVKEEEGAIFPQLAHARLDWENLAAEMDERRRELAPVEDNGDEGRQADEHDVAVGEVGSGQRERSARSRRASAARDS